MKMNRTLGYSLGIATLIFTLGCGKKPMDMEDMATAGDMATSAQDMTATGGDMAVAGDMATGPMVTGLPNCTVANVTAEQVYNGVFRASCAGNGMGCHQNAVAMGAIPAITSAMDLKNKYVGQKAVQTMEVPMVTANNIDKSYLMYKLMGQQAKVSGSGLRMPRTGMGAGTPLNDMNLCLFVNWIKSGAN